MSIPISKYVLITSAVAGAAAVAQRELIGRMFSTDARTPTDAVVEFTSAADVGLYYGTPSQEYLRAVAYFGFTSKSLSRPRKLSFGRYALTAQPARIYGGKPVASLVTLQAITSGTLTVTIGGDVAALTGLNFAASSSFADVAATIQTALRLETGANFTTATVTYDAINGVFVLAASSTQAVEAAISASGSVTGPLGWGLTAIFSPGTPAQSITDALSASVDVSNNFGSFAFVPTLDDAGITEAAQWNAARNMEFIFCARVTEADAANLSAALIGLSGYGPTLAPLATEFPEQLPMAVLAATDYSRAGAVQNYMYQQAALTPSVTSGALSDTYDNLRVNYYGATQTAGQSLAFYQRGVLGGTATDAVDMNVYANEIWLKDAANAAFMALLLASPRIPANVAGAAQVRTALQVIIDQALLNGTISTDKALTVAQRTFIGEVTNDELAWLQVQSNGYWADAVVRSFVTPDSRTEYKVVYTLVYSKDDAIRKIEGSHILV
jgi:hypothetical protein